MRTRKKNPSGYRGVYFVKRLNKWQASICVPGKQKYLGVFETPELASAAYQHALKELDGESISVVLPKEVPNAKWIVLTQGAFALVDAEDYEELSEMVWNLSHNGYAETRKGSRLLKMHKLLFPTTLEVDHVNCDRLDNRKHNLREATGTQNRGNLKLTVANTSGYKGVYYDWARSKWRATIDNNSKSVFLGRFSNSEEAARAYDTAARQYFGEFARLNFPNEGERGCNEDS